ncbi:MAG TPA: hypothetical protein VIZ17_01230 [Acetobacteraceae bacterium]
MLHFDKQEFQDKFNRVHFQLTHDLVDQPEFSLPRLIELAKQTAETRPDDLYCDVGQVEIGQRWETIAKAALPIDELIRRIETQGAWIVLWRAERDPAYSAMLTQVISDILEMTGREVDRIIKKKEIILFITSPNRITTYHIDRECNFLLQIKGQKEISVFSREDREVLPETELERFWTADNNAPIYRPHFQDRADVVMLNPGTGIHIPVNAPHWLKNGDNISVTASFNFQFRDSVRADLYRANYYFRRLGLHPRPPFASPVADVVRQPLGALAYKARQLYWGPRPRD